MRILKFSEFLLESLTPDPLEGIQKFMDDGYRIRVSKKEDSAHSDDILISDDNHHSYSLSFAIGDGGEIWIPKEAIEFKEEDGETVVLIHPEKKWISKNSNRSSLEDFLENYLHHKIELGKNNSEIIEEIKEDIYTILDTLGLNLEISGVEKLGENNYQINLKEGGCLDLTKKGRRNLFANLKFYKSSDDGDPSIVINKSEGIHDFECYPEGLGIKSFRCDLDEVPKNPYYNFLLKKSLAKDTYGDGESLLNFFLDHAQKNPKSPILDDEKESERRRFFKELKSVVSSYVSEEKLRSLLPSNL